MIADRIFTKKIKGVTHKVLEGKEIPKGFFTTEELTKLGKANHVFKDEKARQEYKKAKKAPAKKTEKDDK